MVWSGDAGYRSDLGPIPVAAVPVGAWSPERWRDALLSELRLRQPAVQRRVEYYEGEHPLPIGPKAAQEAYRRLLAQARSNWCQLVVDSVSERLQVVGFRFGNDEVGDNDAWLLWQGNQMDADHEMAHTDSLSIGISYVSVWPDDDSPVGVTITNEHPSQTIVVHDPQMPRRRLAALKGWSEIDGSQFCMLILPDAWWLWGFAQGSWLVKEVQPNPFGVVPVVELRPWPRSRRYRSGELPGRSELDGVLPIQDRINTTVFNRLIATEYAAFRQKYATGLVVPVKRDPATGQPVLDENGNEIPVAPFDVAVDRLWVSEDPAAKFGEFSESDLAGYIASVASDIQHMAAITRTPPHYLLGAMINTSGDALKAAEAGLVSKVQRRSVHLGEAWEEVMRLAFSAIGDPRAVDISAEVIWADFETRSEGERVDALVKMGGLGVPRQVLWQKWGASPQEIARWEAMAAEEAFTAAMVAPAPAPASVPVVAAA
jgi:hypothetical protein